MTAPLLVISVVLVGCATQSPPTVVPQQVPAAWAESTALAYGADPGRKHGAGGVNARAQWWQALQDPVIDRLTTVAVERSPTVAQALARVAEARALVGVAAADGRPQLTGQATTSRSQSASGGSGVTGGVTGGDTGSSSGVDASSAASTAPVTVASVGVSLGWELDLWGRLAYSRAAADQRLQAAEADAQLSLLSLQAQVVDTVLAERACHLLEAAYGDDARSRSATVRLTQRQLDVGAVAPADLARAQSSLAEARGTLAQTRGQCAQQRQALVALTGLDTAALRMVLQRPTASREPTPDPLARSQLQGQPPSTTQSQPGQPAPPAPPEPGALLPTPPVLWLALPATVLKQHPSLRSAAATADAAFNDLGSAKLAHLPSFDLSAMLSNQWLRAFGGTLSQEAWSLGASLSGVLFDGGRIRSNAAAAEARYAQAVSALEQSARSTVQDVETALSQVATASDRIAAAQAGTDAAQRLYTANEAAWRFGRLSLFELEDARRGLVAARTGLIAAQRDLAHGWVAVVKATGNAVEASADRPAS